jgi:hypothetical protein
MVLRFLCGGIVQRLPRQLSVTVRARHKEESSHARPPRRIAGRSAKPATLT